MEDALAAQRRGAIADAKRLYASVLRIDPTNAAAHGNLAIIAAQQGDLVGAERLIRREIELRPDYPASHNNLGSVLQQQGRLVDAIAAHRHAIKFNPNYAEAYLALGNALRQQGSLDQAMEAYGSAIKARRDYAEAHNNIGVLLQAQGRLDEAASAYREAVALRPVYAEAHFNLGVVLHQKHELDAAEASYRRVMSLHPGIAVVHNNLGTVLKDQGRFDQALAAFDDAVRLQPDYAEAFYNRATVLQQQARLEEALAAYGRGRSELRRRLHRRDQQCRHRASGTRTRLATRSIFIGRLLERMPADADACNNMGTALLAGGRSKEAQAAFEQALAHRPDFPEAAYNLGNARRELGDLAGAIAAYQTALQASARLCRRVQPARASSGAGLRMGRLRGRSGKADRDGAAGGARSAVLSVFDAGIGRGPADLRATMDRADQAAAQDCLRAHCCRRTRTHSCWLSIRRFSSACDRAADGRVVRTPQSRSLRGLGLFLWP